MVLLWFIGKIFSNNIDLKNFDVSYIKRYTSLFQLIQFSLLGASFYIMYIAAKTIKTAELKREVTIGEFAVEIFFIWFFFIGVWSLQPRINKIINNEIEEEEHGLLKLP